MAKLQPWFHEVLPREDLREDRPLDASEFAVHLDHIREGRAPKDYQEPERFFERTYLTASLLDLSAQTVRRLSGITVATSPVFNMATQFGGGKTHALTLLYHLARSGAASEGWRGVREILDRAHVEHVQKAATAVFVGTEFDPLTGRGGRNGEPLRRTPWGEIAWQLGGKDAYGVVATHDERDTPPKGDVIRAFLPETPTLILLDEVMNFISSTRRSGLAAQFYNFIQSLSEEARARSNVALAVSIPASALEMNAEDQQDYEKLKKLLDRLGKAILMSSDTEAAEIIRRRLFEWDSLPNEGKKTAVAYAEWVSEHRQMLGDVDADLARESFAACYPFHPAVLSVFERKWQSLPRFQKTRGVLRLLALWVSKAYIDGFKGANKDPLVGLGTAPLNDPYFRAAMFEQLGNSDLEGPVTTDIAGRKEAHAARLDREAPDALKRARLHQKVATTILFESNGGQTRAEATMPEIRFAVAEPDLDIANVETAVEGLAAACYYLSSDRNRYRFSLRPNLNKILIDRRGSIQAKAIDERVKQEVQAVFQAGPSVPERSKFFPTSSVDVRDRASLDLVIMAPDQALGEPATRKLVEQIIQEHGASARTCKSALLFAVPDSPANLIEAARTALAWEEIGDDEQTMERLDEVQKRQLRTKSERAVRDLREAVWRTYKNIVLLGKDNQLKEVDLGHINSSMANTLVELIVNRLVRDDEITSGVGPAKLVKYWPPPIEAWPTKAARDAFYSSPALPRLLDPNALKRAIVDGVAQGLLAYAGKDAEGRFRPLHFQTSLSEQDIEFSDDMYLLRAEEANKQIEPPRLARIELKPRRVQLKPGEHAAFAVSCFDQHEHAYSCDAVTWGSSGGTIDEQGCFAAEAVGSYVIRAKVEAFEATAEAEVSKESPPPPPPAEGSISWSGKVPAQKWMNFYTKVVARFVSVPGLDLEVHLIVPPSDGVTEAKAEEARSALRDLGLSEDLTFK
jgi:hypothetical protein